MTGATTYLDHLLTYVPSLDEAAGLFARMGFRLSPVSHIEPMGISNRLLLMRPSGPGRANFVELMSPHDRSKLAPPMASILSGSAGIKSLVLASDDVAAFQRTVTRVGFAATAPVRTRREWKIPGEASVFPEFDVMLPVEAPLKFNVCRYYNLDLYLRADWLEHPNGARRIAACFAMSEHPQTLAAYAQLLGRPARALAEGGWCFPGGDIDLIVLPPAVVTERFGLVQLPVANPAFLGYEIKVASLEDLRMRLIAERVPFRTRDDALCVDPQTALGNLIVFTQGD